MLEGNVVLISEKLLIGIAFDEKSAVGGVHDHTAQCSLIRQGLRRAHAPPAEGRQSVVFPSPPAQAAPPSEPPQPRARFVARPMADRSGVHTGAAVLGATAQVPRRWHAGRECVRLRRAVDHPVRGSCVDGCMYARCNVVDLRTRGLCVELLVCCTEVPARHCRSQRTVDTRGSIACPHLGIWSACHDQIVPSTFCLSLFTASSPLSCCRQPYVACAS